jgi:hypothetical protein
MYTKLQKHCEINSYACRRGKLEYYYSNLITLYILAYRQREYDLAYVVLLRFQTTNRSQTTTLPDIELVVKAFRHLPEDSPLCKWLAILYAFLWGQDNFGGYRSFIRERPNLDTLALTKLLYEVACIRDPHTEGLDHAVRERWCGVHNHKRGSSDQLLCEQMQAGLKTDSRKASSSENGRLSLDTQGSYEGNGASAIGARGFGHKSPETTRKRKAEDSPTRPYKKTKRGGGYEVGGR